MNTLKIDKVQDVLMYLGDYVVKFCVPLSYAAGQNKERRYFYSQYEYPSKYSDYGNVYTIRRNVMYSYLTIEDKESFENSMMIYRHDMYSVRRITLDMVNWMHDNEQLNMLYGMKNGQLYLKEDREVHCTLSSGRILTYRPTIVDDPIDRFAPGIQVLIDDSRGLGTSIGIFDFMNWYELIRTIDFYGAASGILNSIPLISQVGEDIYGSEDNIPTQQSSLKRTKSFFDN